MTIYAKLMPHQIDICKFIQTKLYFGIFAEYGTGKTLCLLNHIETNNIRKSLIVSTKTAIESTWPQEIKKHTDFKYVILTGAKSKKIKELQRALRMSQVGNLPYALNNSARVIVLINFDGVESIYNELVQAGFDLIGIDESTKIKSPDTDRASVLWSLSKAIPSRAIMTGFPITENISEIYSQIKFLDFGKALGTNYYAFLHKHFNKIGYKFIPRKSGTTAILEAIKPFCIKVSNASLHLKPKIYKEIKLTPTAQQEKFFSELNSTFQLTFGEVNIDTKYIFALIRKSMQICDGHISDAEGNIEYFETPKDKALVDIIDEIDITKNKVIVWFTLLNSLHKVKKILDRLKYTSLTLYGDTDNVGEVTHKFQNSSTHNILLTTQKKASESLNFSNCRYAIYYSNDWSNDLRSNSEARIYRKGSEKHTSIVYIDLTIDKSIDERIVNCLKKKKSLIDDLKTSFGGITK